MSKQQWGLENKIFTAQSRVKTLLALEGKKVMKEPSVCSTRVQQDANTLHENKSKVEE